MIDIKGFFNTDEAKVGAGVAVGIYVTEFSASLLKGIVKIDTGNQWGNFIVSALLKGFVGAILYDFGKENIFVRYMAIGAWTSIILDLMRLVLPEAKAMAARFGRGAVELPVIPAQAVGEAVELKKN